MLLALHQGRPQHRELLVEVLWPEARLKLGGAQSAGRGLQHPPVPGVGRRDRGSHPPAGGRVRAGAAGGGGRRDHLRADHRGGTHRLGAPPPDSASGRPRSLPGEPLPEVGPADWVVEERDRLRLLAAGLAAAAAADAIALADHGVAIDLGATLGEPGRLSRPGLAAADRDVRGGRRPERGRGGARRPPAGVGRPRGRPPACRRRSSAAVRRSVVR